MRIGQVTEIWRHPVKSMQGERLKKAQIVPHYGIPGDRGWALHNEAGEIRGAKRINSLLQFHARYLEEPTEASTPAVEITLPDGSQISSNDSTVSQIISAAVGQELTLCPRMSAEEHNWQAPNSSEAELRKMLDLEPGEPIPDYSNLMELARDALPGTYFDAQPLSLLTTSSMRALSAFVPESNIDSRRFRQNIIVETVPELTGFCEFDWLGRQLKIGSLRARITAPISRCVMTTLPQADLSQDRPILRTLVRETGMDFGIYMTIEEPGEIAEGDAIELY